MYLVISCSRFIGSSHAVGVLGHTRLFVHFSVLGYTMLFVDFISYNRWIWSYHVVASESHGPKIYTYWVYSKCHFGILVMS